MDFRRLRNTLTPSGDKLAVVPLEGRFSAQSASEMRQMLKQVIDFGYPNLLIDMTQVTFIDSVGLGVLVSTLHKCRAAGGQLCLCNVPEAVAMVLQISAMEKVLISFPSLRDGVTKFPSAV